MHDCDTCQVTVQHDNLEFMPRELRLSWSLLVRPWSPKRSFCKLVKCLKNLSSARLVNQVTHNVFRDVRILALLLLLRQGFHGDFEDRQVSGEWRHQVDQALKVTQLDLKVDHHNNISEGWHNQLICYKIIFKPPTNLTLARLGPRKNCYGQLFPGNFLYSCSTREKLLVLNPLITSQSKSEKVNCLNTFVSSKLPAYQKLKLGPYRMLSFQACKTVLKSLEVELDLLELVS